MLKCTSPPVCSSFYAWIHSIWLKEQTRQYLKWPSSPQPPGSWKVSFSILPTNDWEFKQPYWTWCGLFIYLKRNFFNSKAWECLGSRWDHLSGLWTACSAGLSFHITSCWKAKASGHSLHNPLGAKWGRHWLAGGSWFPNFDHRWVCTFMNSATVRECPWWAVLFDVKITLHVD